MAVSPTTRHTCRQGPLSEEKFLSQNTQALALGHVAHPPALRYRLGFPLKAQRGRGVKR